MGKFNFWSNASGGSSLPSGGTTGQILEKVSNADGDAGWTTPASGTTPDGVTIDALGAGGSLEVKAGSIGTTQLANSGVTAGTYGDGTNIPAITVDAKGRVTDVVSTPITVGSGSSDSISRQVTQTAHGFTVGQAVHYNGTVWVLAEADSAANADIEGIVSTVTDANTFTVTYTGYVSGLSGLTAGSDYFLSPTTPGALTATEPQTAGQVSSPVGKAISATELIVNALRGLVIPPNATFSVRIVLIADSTALAVKEDFAGYTLPITSDLNGYTLTSVVWLIKTTSSSGLPSFGIRKNAATEMLSTNVTIDVGETSSETATTPAVINGANAAVATGDLIHFDCDAAGTSAAGSEVLLTFTA